MNRREFLGAAAGLGAAVFTVIAVKELGEAYEVTRLISNQNKFRQEKIEIKALIYDANDTGRKNELELDLNNTEQQELENSDQLNAYPGGDSALAIQSVKFGASTMVAYGLGEGAYAAFRPLLNSPSAVAAPIES